MKVAPCRPACRPGLSLLEVLLALAIFVIALAAIGTLVNGGNDRGADARQLHTATRLALGKLAELEAGVTSFEQTSGTFDPPDDAWSWVAEAEVQTASLYRVTVTVYRELGGRRFEFSLSQLMLDPSVKGSAARATRPIPETAGEAP